ncbi:hypothetical protein ISN45_At05g027430 [Arabidopsis thaliana x Arabidopsis arenosa]|uniref:Uncharacterized protein n=1 Tax=Arabidopsis thaliana x Arabidopsis arenosa TaxID=1240361 RepID=A0A8T2CW03_9BRAS|nr:hypothetical protein ISN45_At05g027430 [Arabidopsis thaliana x Arabidopsis arenosa]
MANLSLSSLSNTFEREGGSSSHHHPAYFAGFCDRPRFGIIVSSAVNTTFPLSCFCRQHDFSVIVFLMSASIRISDSFLWWSNGFTSFSADSRGAHHRSGYRHPTNKM